MRTGKQRRRNPEAKLTNPIIAAILRGREEKTLVWVIDVEGPVALYAADLRSIAGDLFSDDVCREVGDFILASLGLGYREAINVLEDAFKHADRIFHRNREQVLLKRTIVVMKEIGETGENPERLKKAVEERFYDGKPLAQYRWNRVSDVLGLPKLKTGTAANNYNWETRREKLKENRRRKRRRKPDTE
jgi:hypothetical protein